MRKQKASPKLDELKALAGAPAAQVALAIEIVEREKDVQALRAALDVLRAHPAWDARPALLGRYAALAADGVKRDAGTYLRAAILQALRPLLKGVELPLILAAVEPMDSIYRSVNSYPHLLPTSVSGNPEAVSDGDLAESARRLLDDLYAAELRATRETYALRTSQRRASADIADVARAATYGLVDTVLVDIDEVVPGHVDEETGAVSFDAAGDAVERLRRHPRENRAVWVRVGRQERTRDALRPVL